MRAGLVLLAAGLTGGGAMVILLIASEMIAAILSPGSSMVGVSVMVGVVAFPFWLVGAFVVAPPLWATLHFARRRDRRTALVAGAVAGSLAVPAVLWLLAGGGAPGLSPESAAGVALLSAIAGASGAIAGEVIHRLAYRPAEAVDAR